MNNKKRIRFLVCFLAMVYYIVISAWFRRQGVFHTEALFYSEKIKLLFQQDENTFRTIAITFSPVVFYSAIPFSLISYEWAPVLSSCLYISVLLFSLLKDCQGLRATWVGMVIVLPLFLLHPGLVYAAISGGSTAAVLLFFYLLFRSLFGYYRTQTSYYLATSSIYLACLIFSDFDYVWLLVSFLPFVVLISLEGLKVNKMQEPIVQYYETLNNTSLRRKLFNRTFATYIIIFILPVGAILLFRTLNTYHAGSSDYFLTSPYANWLVSGAGQRQLGPALGKYNYSLQSQIIMQLYILLCTPLLIAVFLFFRGKVYELFTLVAPFILISILILQDSQYKGVAFYLIFLVLALVATVYYLAAGKYSKRNVLFVIAAAWLSIAGGLLYFANTSDAQEAVFRDQLLERVGLIQKDTAVQQGNNKEDNEQLAAYVRRITRTGKLLIDDAAAYPVVARLSSIHNLVLPVQNQFLTIVEDPAKTVKYLCIARQDNPLEHVTMLNLYYLQQLLLHHKKMKLLLENRSWQLYELYP